MVSILSLIVVILLVDEFLEKEFKNESSVCLGFWNKTDYTVVAQSMSKNGLLDIKIIFFYNVNDWMICTIWFIRFIIVIIIILL